MSAKRMHLFVRLALPILATAVAGPAFAQAVEGKGSSQVKMFERPPSVEELRSVVNPEPMPKIRTRGIEIVGGGIATGQRPLPTEPAAATSTTGPMDYQDQTPTGQTYETATTTAPEAAPTEPAGQPGTFGFRINFALNSATIPRDAYAYIDAVGGLLAQEPQIGLLVEGHTDASGSNEYNQRLSERRAAAVQEYLLQIHGIDPNRVVARGMGETEPLMENAFDGLNRRVEFERIN